MTCVYKGTPVFVGYPAAFDFMFITYYLYRFAGESPFSYFALDIKSYAMAMMKNGFHEVNKSTMPKHWFDDLPYTHVALDDAGEGAGAKREAVGATSISFPGNADRPTARRGLPRTLL